MGAGLSGALVAICLARAGHSVEVYEQQSDADSVADAGRSINLGLSERGMRALADVGLLDEVLPRSVPMRGRVIHQRDGALDFQSYGRLDEHVLRSVLRSDLRRILIKAAESTPGVRIRFDARLTHLDRGHPGRPTVCRFIDPRTGTGVETAPDLVVGADGTSSTVRTHLLRGLTAELRQQVMPWGYKELTIPRGPAGDLRVTPDALHVWPARDGLVVAHPNTDGSLTASVFLPLDGPAGPAALTSPAAVDLQLRTRFPDLFDIVPDLVEQFLRHPVGHVTSVRVDPWQHGGAVVLIGDAAHAVYPFYGQGMNAALEDCTTLRDCLAGSDWVEGLRRFEGRRKPNTDVLATLSERNFEELRSRVASPAFLALKQADQFLGRALPRRWVPLYTMISHTTIPYADAVRRVHRQRAALAAAGFSTAAATWLVGRSALRRRAARDDGGAR